MTGGLWVVGLDLATVSGVARTHDRNGQPRLAVDTIDASGMTLHRKVDSIEQGVRRRCGWWSGNWKSGRRPDLAVVEGSFSAGNAADYLLHAIRSHVLQWLYRRQIPYVEVAPSTLKVFATGRGDATKQDVCERVIADYGRLLHINPRDDNQCDAVALMAMGLAAYAQPLADVPETQTRALKGLSWPPLGGA